MVKQINQEWMQSLLAQDTNSKNTNDLPKVDWVQNGKSFKRDIKFKVLPANSRENNIFALIIGQHWNLGPNKDQHFICPEQSAHLKKQGIVCPICEARRKLLALGFKEEDLTTEGKYGPVSVFEPNITCNVKAVVLSTDLKNDWDQAHVSVLQQKGTYLARWLVDKYIDTETPDFLQYETSNIIHFSRSTDNGKWEREIAFTQFIPSDVVAAKIKQENEDISLPDIWKMPSDEDLLKMREIADTMIREYKEAKNSMNTESVINDKMPF